MHCGEFWCILVTSWATPWLLHDLLWLLSPFKRPYTQERAHIKHSGQIQNTLLCHALPWYSDLFGPFWCILLHFVAPHTHCHDPFMTCSDYYPLSRANQTKKKIMLVTQDKSEKLFLSCYFDHSGLFWSMLVHFMGDPTSPLHQRYVLYALRTFTLDQSHLLSSIRSWNTALTWALSMG